MPRARRHHIPWPRTLVEVEIILAQPELDTNRPGEETLAQARPLERVHARRIPRARAHAPSVAVAAPCEVLHGSLMLGPCCHVACNMTTRHEHSLTPLRWLKRGTVARVRTLDVTKADLSQVGDGGVGCGDKRRRKVHHAAAATASVASSIAASIASTIAACAAASIAAYVAASTTASTTACVAASITTSTTARVFEHQTLGEPAPQPMCQHSKPVGGARVCKYPTQHGQHRQCTHSGSTTVSA